MAKIQTIKTKRVPYGSWPAIATRYNAKHGTNFGIPYLQQMVARGDLEILETIADVLNEKKDDESADVLRVKAKLEQVGLA